MTERVVFLHIPKTGGTTLHRLLGACFAPVFVCPERLAGLDRYAPGQLAQYRLYSGHYSYESARERIPRPWRMITLLREPQARALSEYWFRRSHKLEFIERDARFVDYRLAKVLGLADYLAERSSKIRDRMVNWIAGPDGPADERLARARERLRDMTAFGLTERMDDSVRHIFGRLGLPRPEAIPREMAFEHMPDEHDHIERIEREPVTAGIRHRLDELCALDSELYRYAVGLFEERLAAESAAPALPADWRGARPLQVLYDASVLGYGQIDNRCRTGVYRVVENVGRRLAGGEADLAFCAVQSWRAVEGAQRYLAAHRGFFPDVPFVAAAPFAEAFSGLARVDESLRALDAGIPFPGGRAEAPGFFANLRESIGRTIRYYGEMARTLAPGDLRGFDVFHSTFYPLPGHLRAAPGVSRFATVYDLIPLMLPELFSGHGNNELEFQRMVDTLQALTPDDHVLCISKAVRDDLLGFAPLDPEKVSVTYLAADPALFYPVTDAAVLAAARSRYGIGEGHYLLGVSTLEPRKNFDHLIRCYVRLVREEAIADLRLVLVGARGWNYEPIFEELRRAGLSQDRVVFTGYVADSELAPLYSGALAFVYPSLYEGFGLPPLEAMQCGTPVITSDNSSLPEVVGEAGIMVDPRDADELCAAMLRLYRDGALRADLARRALERAAWFTWERTAEQTLAAYRAARG